MKYLLVKASEKVRTCSKPFIFLSPFFYFLSNPWIAKAQNPTVANLIGTIKPPSGVDVYVEKYGPYGGLIPFFNNILRLVFIIAGLFAFLNIIFAGFQFMTAGGDPKKIQAAWARIWQSFVGLIILVSSFLIAAIVGIVLFGDPTAILNPKITGAPGG